MTREEKLEAIYKEMANKELTFGCKLKFDIGGKKSIYDESDIATEPNYGIIKGECEYEDNIQLFLNYTLGSYAYFRTNCEDEVLTYSDDYEIIGHPVMLGTIFERYSASKGFINSQFILALVDKWTGYDRSIEEQSDKCIDYVYSLIKK